MDYKIIFLDIDGVLNNSFTKERFKQFTGVDARLCKMFLDWLKQRDYSVILSSTWRREDDFQAELQRNGLSWIDETPLLGRCRGQEIEVSIECYKPVSYAILDDYGSTEFLKYQRPFLVQTSAVKGLEEKKLAKIDELLGASHDVRDKARSIS